MSVRTRIKSHTKAQLAAMTQGEVDRHVQDILKEVETIKRDLTYLYKALPGDRKTDEMKAFILPFEFSRYKKAPPKTKK